MLCSMGVLTVEKIQEGKLTKKSIKLPTTVNPDTGEQSAQHMSFSEVSWGKLTQLYLKSISSRVDDEAMEAIMSEAKASQRPATRRICRTELTQTMSRLMLTNIHLECLMMSRVIMTCLMVVRLKFKVSVHFL